MGLLSSLLLLPVKGPADGTLWVAKKITEAAQQQMNDKTALRAALLEAEEQLLAGEMSEDEYDEIETIILTRMRENP